MKTIYCPNCNEYIRPETPGKCLPLKGKGRRVIPCPCCYGWGRHEGWIDTPVCETCGGKRMVIEKIIYERVE